MYPHPSLTSFPSSVFTLSLPHLFVFAYRRNRKTRRETCGRPLFFQASQASETEKEEEEEKDEEDDGEVEWKGKNELKNRSEALEG